MIVKLLGYMPDADPTIPGVLTNCSGVVPSLKGMKAAPSPAASGMASLGVTCQGAALLYKLDGTNRFFAGSPTKLYEAGVSTWSDVSRSAAYTLPSTARWRFTQNNNVSLATNGADTMQASVTTGPFSCVPGAPAAYIVENVGQFVFALGTSANPNGWQCSALGDYQSWTVSIATQAASGTLSPSPGPITAGRAFGTSIVVYKKTSMYLGTYVGPPTIWQFDQIPGTAGAMSQESVINIGTLEYPKHIFMGEDDFYLYDGAKPIPIGTSRVKQTVFGSIVQNRYYACCAVHDRKNNLVYFYYPVADSIFPDHCIVYNYRTDRWGVDDRQIQIGCDFAVAETTYDSLGGNYTTYADLPNLPYDIAFLNSMQTTPAIFDTNNNLKTLTGVATNSSFTTGDFGDDAQFITVTRIRPRFLTKPTSATWTHAYRNNEGETLTADTASTLSSGAFDILRSARWHRGTMDMVGDWEMAGFAPEWAKDGSE